MCPVIIFFSGAQNQRAVSQAAEAELPVLDPQDFLHLTDFLLDLSTKLFALAFCLQVGIVCHSSNFFLHFTFHFVELAFGFVFRAWLHELSLLKRNLTLSATAMSRSAPVHLQKQSRSVRCGRGQRNPPTRYTTTKMSSTVPTTPRPPPLPHLE